MPCSFCDICYHCSLIIITNAAEYALHFIVFILFNAHTQTHIQSHTHIHNHIHTNTQSHIFNPARRDDNIQHDRTSKKLNNRLAHPARFPILFPPAATQTSLGFQSLDFVYYLVEPVADCASHYQSNVITEMI